MTTSDEVSRVVDEFKKWFIEYNLLLEICMDHGLHVAVSEAKSREWLDRLFQALNVQPLTVGESARGFGYTDGVAHKGKRYLI